MRKLRVTKTLGNVAYFDDGPRPDREYEVGDMVEARAPNGAVIDIGVIVQPTADEAALPREATDHFINWATQGRKWTRWQDFCPRY